jgi:hypothetical protein
MDSGTEVPEPGKIERVRSREISVDDKKLNGGQLWESAYSFLEHPRMGSYLHGAGIVERTTGATHYWLVRGPCTKSVVQELQSQLGKVYRFTWPGLAASPVPSAKSRPKDRPTDRLL